MGGCVPMSVLMQGCSHGTQLYNDGLKAIVTVCFAASSGVA